jgi:rhodanese-related sulfurtransferase
MNFLKNLFRRGKTDFAQLIGNGAMVIDVRTKEEFGNGHIKGSENIPLSELSRNYTKLDKSKVYIFCCASGMRSASACRLLKSKGYTHVYNAGSWHNLGQYVK